MSYSSGGRRSSSGTVVPGRRIMGAIADAGTGRQTTPAGVAGASAVAAGSNEVPQPQVRTALGFSIRKPVPVRPS